MDVVAYEKNFGQQCPRTPLDQDNAEAADILGFLADERLRPMSPTLFDALCGDRSPEDRARIIRRIEAAMCDPNVVAIMYPKAPEPEK